MGRITGIPAAVAKSLNDEKGHKLVPPHHTIKGFRVLGMRNEQRNTMGGSNAMVAVGFPGGSFFLLQLFLALPEGFSVIAIHGNRGFVGFFSPIGACCYRSFGYSSIGRDLPLQES